HHFPYFDKVFESLARSNAPSCIWYLPGKDNYCSMPVPKVEQEEVFQQESFAHSITKDSLSGELRRLESFAQSRCCINFHRNKLPENGLLRKLAVRWLEEIILRSSVSGSLELLEQLAVLPKEFPAVSESVTFVKHEVFVQKTLDTVLDDRVQPEEANIGSLYIYTHEKKAFARMIKIGQTGNTVESRLEKWSKCGHGDPTPLCTFEWICHPQRVELLTHFELVDHRRETWCMVHSRSHMEWFDIDVETAGSIIMHWSSWMKLKPYNDQGRLRPFWKVAIKFLTKHRTLKGETMLQMQEVKEDGITSSAHQSTYHTNGLSIKKTITTMPNKSSGGGEKHAMSGSDASRIQSAQAKSGGDMSSSGFAARAQSGAANNANAASMNTGSGTAGGKGMGGDKK
ncbi:hypothetical protein KCU73_g9723, partial [Aureobasidium melanogenum]